MVPTRDGLVIAADSRVSNEFQTRYCDQDFKIIEIGAGPSHTAATITNVVWLKEPSNDPDYCHGLNTAKTWLDLRMEFKSFIESQPLGAAEFQIVQFQSRLNQVFSALPARVISALRPLNSKPISMLVVASYDPDTSTSWVRYATVALTATSQPVIEEEVVDRIDLGHEKVFYRLGEQEYVNKQMANGNLLSLLHNPITLPFLTTSEKVRSVSKDEAIAVAIDFIGAVSDVARRIPPPHGIGGPIDVLFVGAKERPERIEWKTVHQQPR